MSFQAQDFQVRGPPLRGRARDPANIMPGGNGWRRPRRRSAQSAAHVVGAQFVTFRRCAQLTHTVESAWSIQALVAGAPHDEQYDARAARTDGYGAEWSHDDRRRCCRLYHVLMLHLHLACTATRRLTRRRRARGASRAQRVASARREATTCKSSWSWSWSW